MSQTVRMKSQQQEVSNEVKTKGYAFKQSFNKLRSVLIVVKQLHVKWGALIYSLSHKAPLNTQAV